MSEDVKKFLLIGRELPGRELGPSCSPGPSLAAPRPFRVGDNGPRRLSCRWALAQPPQTGSWAARSLLSHRWGWGCHHLLRLKGHAFREDSEPHVTRTRPVAGSAGVGSSLSSRGTPSGMGADSAPGRVPPPRRALATEPRGLGEVSSGVPRGRARRGSCPRWVPSVQGRAPEARGARAQHRARGREGLRALLPHPCLPGPTSRPEQPWAEC